MGGRVVSGYLGVFGVLASLIAKFDPIATVTASDFAIYKKEKSANQPIEKLVFLQ